MPKTGIPTWFIVLVVVRDGDRWLMVQEARHDRGSWYLPAGRAEAGETFVEAAERETLEEAGVPIVVEGVIRVEHSPSPSGARVRALLTARPKARVEPKKTADEHSLQAAWFTLDEIRRLRLRGGEAREMIEHVARGAPVAPLTILAHEADPF